MSRFYFRVFEGNRYSDDQFLFLEGKRASSRLAFFVHLDPMIYQLITTVQYGTTDAAKI
jgi:hypothetical protein